MEGTPFGRYRLLSLLGRGGMGEVWRARDTDIDRVVALKVLPEHLTDDDVFHGKFRSTVRVAAGLSEPHVVPIHHYGEIDGRLYVDMRLIVATDLETLLHRGPLDPTRAVKIIEHVAGALHAAHEVGLVHRDVKPSNVLIAENDFAYLDFSLAGMADAAGVPSGSSFGAWAYLAPERFGTGEPDAGSDVYALACVLHECLTGQRPFPGDRIEQQVAGHMSTPPPKPSAVNHWLPTAFDGVIARGMAKDPGRRYGTAVALAQAASAACGSVTASPGHEPPERARVFAAPPTAPPTAEPFESSIRMAPTEERLPPVHRIPLSDTPRAEPAQPVEKASPPPPVVPPRENWRASSAVEHPARRSRSGAERAFISLALLTFVGIVGVVVAFYGAKDGWWSSYDPTSQAIRSAGVGDCISRAEGGVNSNGTPSVTVTLVACGSPAATHRVALRTNDLANCRDQPWVRSFTPQPVVVLCLQKE